MFPDTLYAQTAQVLTKLAHAPHQPLKNFYMAGGTALAIQLGHRKSIDLDFFTAEYPEHELLIQSLAPFNPTIIQQAPGTLDVLIDQVKTSFLSYNYPLLAETNTFETVPLASVLDIACMKMSAISSRSVKKDFADLYYILKSGYSLEQILTSCQQKFAHVNYSQLHLLKSLVYFQDAEDDPDPEFQTDHQITWDDIKKYLQTTTTNYLQTVTNPQKQNTQR